MAVEVVLLKEVENLGNKGDIVFVKEGYARNFLLARGLARLATQEAKQEVQRLRREEKKVVKEKEKEARQLLDSLAKEKLVIKRKAEKGKLFGSVKVGDLLKLLKEKGIELKKSQLNLGGQEIKKIGEYEVTVEPFKGVSQKIKIKVSDEKK